MACIHSRTGCHRGTGSTFRFFELACDTPAAASYTDHCRSCWTRAGPIFDVAEVNTDSDGISASSDIERRVRGLSDTNSLMSRGGAKWIGQDSEEILSAVLFGVEARRLCAGPLRGRGTQNKEKVRFLKATKSGSRLWWVLSRLPLNRFF